MAEKSETTFQSTCPARGTTPCPGGPSASREISIHVPREGHDAAKEGPPAGIPYFNPRAPRGARQAGLDDGGLHGVISIHVPREGHDSFICMALSRYWSNFNPRAPRGARRDLKVYVKIGLLISIHVPREGHDFSYSCTMSVALIFQSTCPARGTTLPAVRSRPS